MKQIVSLELNELNFHFVKEFVARGELPAFARILETCDLVETVAEKSYPNLEPWIQWPTVYTGKSYAEHQIFRLGDVVYSDHVQIWDYLEDRGVKVGAVSPMNAKNRCAAPAFFLPDPWTDTPLVAEPRVAKLFGLVRQIVNNNASQDPSFLKTGAQLLPLALPYMKAGSLPQYARILKMAARYKWAKAAFLDQLLADLFSALLKKYQPGYSSLFLNAGAHIQHHHTYDSAAYRGARSNPEWYSRAAKDEIDPLLFIYRVYDNIIAGMLANPDYHVFITTGLSQVPNERDHYQYRIRDFDGFIERLGIVGAVARPRMSRDFLLEFDTVEKAKDAIVLLDKVRCGDAPLFRVEDRGATLFCQVGYFGRPEGLREIDIDGRHEDCSSAFVLVSIENAIHQTTGYHIDTLRQAGSSELSIPLTEVFHRLCSATLEDREGVRLVS